MRPAPGRFETRPSGGPQHDETAALGAPRPADGHRRLPLAARTRSCRRSSPPGTASAGSIRPGCSSVARLRSGRLRLHLDRADDRPPERRLVHQRARRSSRPTPSTASPRAAAPPAWRCRSACSATPASTRRRRSPGSPSRPSCSIDDPLRDAAPRAARPRARRATSRRTSRSRRGSAPSCSRSSPRLAGYFLSSERAVRVLGRGHAGLDQRVPPAPPGHRPRGPPRHRAGAIALRASATAGSSRTGGLDGALDLRLPRADGRAGRHRRRTRPDARPVRLRRRVRALVGAAHARRRRLRRGRPLGDPGAGRHPRARWPLLGTLVFRLFSFWLPLPAGAAAAIAFRRRYRPAA